MIFNWFWGKLPIQAVPDFSRGKGRLHRDQPDSEESGRRRRKVFPISAYWQRRPTHGRARSINLRECATDVSQPLTQCLGRVGRKGERRGSNFVKSPAYCAELIGNARTVPFCGDGRNLSLRKPIDHKIPNSHRFSCQPTWGANANMGGICETAPMI